MSITQLIMLVMNAAQYQVAHRWRRLGFIKFSMAACHHVRKQRIHFQNASLHHPVVAVCCRLHHYYSNQCIPEDNCIAWSHSEPIGSHVSDSCCEFRIWNQWTEWNNPTLQDKSKTKAFRMRSLLPSCVNNWHWPYRQILNWYIKPFAFVYCIQIFLKTA